MSSARKAVCSPNDLVPSSASRVEFSLTQTTELLGKTGRTSCGASFASVASLASFLGLKVHELLF